MEATRFYLNKINLHFLATLIGLVKIFCIIIVMLRRLIVFNLIYLFFSCVNKHIEESLIGRVGAERPHCSCWIYEKEGNWWNYPLYACCMLLIRQLA